MSSLTFSLFDLFSYTIPGLFVLVTVFAGINTHVVEVFDITRVFDGMNVITGIAMVAAGYVVGFAIDTPGSWLYYKVAWRVWGSAREASVNGVSEAHERALVRHFSPENENYLQLWKVTKTMSHNLAFGCVVATICSFFKLVQAPVGFRFGWISAMVMFVFAGLIFLKRAYTFDRWFYHGLSTIVEALKLRENTPLTEKSIPKSSDITIGSTKP